MKRPTLVVVGIMLATVWPSLLPLHAAGKYNACSLLTTRELEMALHARVAISQETDVPVHDGPYKGETVTVCNWVVGSTYVTLSITRAPRNAAERAAGIAMLRDADDALKKQGWTIVEVNVGGVQCASYRPPPQVSNVQPGAGCVRQAKGLVFSLGVIASRVRLTPQQVKALSDKAAARLK